MKDNNLLKFLIPLVAVLVIAESVVIISGVDKKTGDIGKQKVMEEALVNSQKPVVTVKKEVAVAELLFDVQSTGMKVGKSYEVGLNVLPKKDLAVDALDIYIKYNPEAFEVSDLVAGVDMTKPQFAKISKDKSLLVMNYLISTVEGLKLKSGESMAVSKFTVTPKTEGSFDFEISSGGGQNNSVTMLVESGSAKVLPISSSSLTVSVTK